MQHLFSITLSTQFPTIFFYQKPINYKLPKIHQKKLIKYPNIIKKNLTIMLKLLILIFKY